MARTAGGDSELRRARTSRNWTLEEAAERLNRISGGATDASLLSAWESGRRRTGARMRAALCELYGGRTEVLFAHQEGAAVSALEASGTAVVVKVLTRYTDLVEAMVRVVCSARETLVVTGSRSREKTYLGAIETVVAQQPDLVHYRVLYGPPRDGGSCRSICCGCWSCGIRPRAATASRRCTSVWSSRRRPWNGSSWRRSRPPWCRCPRFTGRRASTAVWCWAVRRRLV